MTIIDTQATSRPHASRSAREPSSQLLRLAKEIIAKHGAGPDAARAMAAEVIRINDLMLLVTLVGGIDVVGHLCRQYFLDNAAAVGTTQQQQQQVRRGNTPAARRVAAARKAASTAALAATQRTIASSLMDTIVIGGRSIGNHKISKIRKLAARAPWEASLLQALVTATSEAKGPARVRAVLDESQLAKIVADLGGIPDLETQTAHAA